MVNPQHDQVAKASPYLPVKLQLAALISVARVRPRTSKGITDLLLPSFHRLVTDCRAKKTAREASRPPN